MCIRLIFQIHAHCCRRDADQDTQSRGCAVCGDERGPNQKDISTAAYHADLHNRDLGSSAHGCANAAVSEGDQESLRRNAKCLVEVIHFKSIHSLPLSCFVAPDVYSATVRARILGSVRAYLAKVG